MPRRLAITFQDCASSQIMHLFNLHEFIMSIITIVIILILYIIRNIIKSKNYYKIIREGTLIETIWSIIPAILLILLVFPSIKILYLAEDIKKPENTIKIVGHQWYWTYIIQRIKTYKITRDTKEWATTNQIKYDSTIEWKLPRILSCNNIIICPELKNSRLLITSADVIHSFSIPALGLKVDRVPGRINQIFLTPFKRGYYIGMCSEICGANHAFIPIVIKVVRANEYESYFKIFTIFITTKLIRENTK